MFYIDTQSLCWIRYQKRIRSTSTGSHVPWCRLDGSFSPLQVQGSQFFCISNRGDEIAGTSVDVSLGKPDCSAASKCHKHLKKYTEFSEGLFIWQFMPFKLYNLIFKKYSFELTWPPVSFTWHAINCHFFMSSGNFAPDLKLF